MIAGDNQLELRRVLEEILPHEPRRNLVAACERFDSALGPAAAFFRFDGGDETGAAQTCKVCGVTVNGWRRKWLDWSRAVMISGGSHNCIEECCLSVCAKPIEEEKGVLLCRASEGIPGYALKVC